ncbi:TRAP transporter small permease subunit [Marinobacter sp. M3C]|jgi:TRAP-type mannitol/chloroaromatic compound transport system permease small subunit|uniref:TRAP transporter small permease subunit n=1 Tax=Marinobacter sp. M3C TaxID=2917715 RepID=UPI00200BBC02|nr:TRAP transporter small permease subunit [Marinobacter sp. M3C]MCL1476225.1 TRAP transporter small permease subunit [Marinobacter sp.]MCL1482980.1 TRAP transporter small permease subunit [Marinobacter sp.]MCL1488794.1 TRAP transporter small permease subunit [Marinobacter sp.]UQG60579.1 TRAP transporter small permease subunit [Marinobacter sp. M3C]
MAKNPFATRAISAGDMCQSVFAVLGRYSAGLVLVIIAVVLLSVVGSSFGWSDLGSWETSLPLFGNHLNMVSIAELQWHLFALLVMVSGSYVLQQDRHIRVDLLSARMSPKGRVTVDLVGDLLFLLPFFGCLAWFSFGYVENSFLMGEQSNSGGLIDRYLVKATMPLGAFLLLGCGLGRILKNIGILFQTDECASNKARMPS